MATAYKATLAGAKAARERAARICPRDYVDKSASWYAGYDAVIAIIAELEQVAHNAHMREAARLRKVFQ